MPPKTKTPKDVASKAKNSKKTASTDNDENEGKASAKTPRNFIPEPTKAMIVNEIKHRYRYLNGAFDHKHTATQRLTKWNEILDICLADPEAKKHISSAKDVKDKFQKWKQNLNTKVSKENYTGASPADHWTESEKVIYNIVNEFADYRMSLKKASPDAGLQHLKASKQKATTATTTSTNDDLGEGTSAGFAGALSLKNVRSVMKKRAAAKKSSNLYVESPVLNRNDDSVEDPPYQPQTEDNEETDAPQVIYFSTLVLYEVTSLQDISSLYRYKLSIIM